jgi:hypothetical protein
MAKGVGDGLATSSRDVDAQSECCVHYVAVIQYDHNKNRISLYYCFRKINHLIPIAICIHPLMYGKLCRAQLVLLKKSNL